MHRLLAVVVKPQELSVSESVVMLRVVGFDNYNCVRRKHDNSRFLKAFQSVYA